MKKHFEKKFQVTEEGARALVHASLSCTAVYIVSMFPIILLMLFGDAFLNGHDYGRGVYLGVAVSILVVLFFALMVEYEHLFNATYKESANLRIRIAKRLERIPLSYFSKRDLSDLAQSIMADVAAIEHAMSHAIPKVYGLYIFFPLIGVMLLLGNPLLGLAVIVPNILRFVVLALHRTASIRGNRRYYRILRENSERFQETIEMHREIRGLSMNDTVREELDRRMDMSEREHIRTEMVGVRALSLSALFSFVSLGVVLVVGTRLLTTGAVDLLTLIGYMLAAIKVKEMVDLTNETVLEVLNIEPSVAKLKEINDEILQEGEDHTPAKYDIRLEDVGFSYRDDTTVLKDVSFEARQGEVTALVGASGSGKSTLLRLISRLYDYDRGKILLDGRDLMSISTDSLFGEISIVFQDVKLFNNSVLENIRIGKLTATDEEVIEAAKLANCMDFIEKLPEGFQSFIGENGAELSGGERQRLSIARAFLKDAPILILDEIAANLDIENERKIQESLSRLARDKTVIVISHRLKSIEQADKIVVLRDGVVESAGTHEELIKHSPTYRNLLEKTRLAEEFVY